LGDTDPLRPNFNLSRPKLNVNAKIQFQTSAEIIIGLKSSFKSLHCDSRSDFCLKMFPTWDDFVDVLAA